ncbi:MAG: competence/damage-inducible protein A [Bacteroidota bacterium]
MKDIYAEIITIGDEILYGQITDTNSQWIGKELSKIGIKIIRKTSVGDYKEEIVSALNQALERATIILMTGGLGPTKDDITKKTIAEYVGASLVLDEGVLENIKNIFKSRNRKMNDLNKSQAYIPENSTALKNSSGTAPGMWIDYHNKILISLPGVPHEMKNIMLKYALPKLNSAFDTPYIYHKMIKTIGIGESRIAPMIEHWENHLPDYIKLAYLPRLGQVRLRITGVGAKEQIISEVEAQTKTLAKIIEKYIYAFDDEEVEVTVGKLLKKKKLTLATAESCTGGRVADKITDIPGCSLYFKGGIIAYSNEVKTSQLGVQETTLEKFGAVSETTAKEMAEQVRIKYSVDFGISTTGVAGPDGGTPKKPIGTVYIGVSSAKETTVKLLNLSEDRMVNIQLTYIAVLDLLRQQLLSG